MRRSAFFLIFSVALLASDGCGDDTTPPDPGRTDAATGCAPGQHICGGTSCVDDHSNDPGLGCRLGCGVPCRAPTGGTSLCLSSGVCDFTCTAPYVRGGDTCRCTPLSCRTAMAQCGTADDGCGGRLSCGTCAMGSECVDNRCVCVDDDAEPNDVDVRAFRLGTFPDEPDTMMSFDVYTLHTMDDVDFYRARIVDAAMSNPTIRVTLTGVPTTNDWEVGMWFACDTGGDTSLCNTGAADTTFGVGCVAATGATGMARVQLQTFCATTSEDGDLLIRVQSTTWTNACMPYHLTVEVS